MTSDVDNLTISGADILAGMGNGGAPVIQGNAVRSKQIQYWHKCKGCSYHIEELNWVTTGPVMTPRTAIEFTEFQANKHGTPLDQYGRYTIGKVSGQKYDLTDAPRRFQAIIELNGIHEFPIDQMIAYNWHRFDVMRKVVPELVDVKEIPCEYGCSNRKFFGNTNYINHLSVMHKDVMQSEAIGKQFKDAMIAMNGGSFNSANQAPPLTAEMITALVTAAMNAHAGNIPREVTTP